MTLKTNMSLLSSCIAYESHFFQMTQYIMYKCRKRFASKHTFSSTNNPFIRRKYGTDMLKGKVNLCKPIFEN